MKFTNILLLAALIFASSCTMAPKYKSPAVPVTNNWGEDEIYAVEKEFDVKNLELENFITDKRLLSIINMALTSNRDLRSIVYDVEAVRALYRVERAKLFPSIYGAANAGQAQAANGVRAESYSLEAGLSVFEIDLFGKNRSLKNSALQKYFAAEQGARAAKISLISEIANAWLTLAADKEMLKLATDTVENAKQSCEIAERRFNAGVTSEIDVYQSKTIYFQAKADAANYTAVVAQDINALELLAGGGIDKTLFPDGFNDDSQAWIGNISPGLSSDILLRRPDIAAAEHTLKSANADIGAARAAFFPSISLVSSAGLVTNEFANLFSGGASSIWSYGGNISLPIFQGGRNMANLKYSKAKYQSYLAQYDKTIQTAFREVKDALARRATIHEQLQAQNDLTNASRSGYKLAEMRYDKGVDTYLNVLQLQRTYYDSEKALIHTRLTELGSRITLYRVLGGGEEKSFAGSQK